MADSDKPRVVVLAGGRGCRFFQSLEAEERNHSLGIEPGVLKRLLEWEQKTMMPVGGIPLVEHVMRSFQVQGYDDFLVLAGHASEEVERHFAQVEFNKWRVEVDTPKDEKTVVQRLMEKRDALGTRFLLTLGDTLSSTDVTSLIKQHKEEYNQVTNAILRIGFRPFAGTAVMESSLLTPEGNPSLDKHAREKEGIFDILIDYGSIHPVETYSNMNELSDWARMNSLWEHGKAFWHGAYSKRIPMGLDKAEIDRLADELPKPREKRKNKN